MGDDFYVEYKVSFKPNETFKAGPYKGIAEAQYQATDIAGFEGVHSVRIIWPVKND